jgi:GMP synthase (glutamine-hydrolysing)
MRPQEVGCFARALQVEREQITPVDLLSLRPSPNELAQHDMVLLGGSGDYSATSTGAWIAPILDCLSELESTAKPTFASCWGFQAMARALGGEVIHDKSRAELGTQPVRLTGAGRADPVFGPLGEQFPAQMGHEDCVVQLPQGAVCLASTNRVENQAYTFPGRPIYCTQFHPELDRRRLIERLQTYPGYIERIAGMPLAEFEQHCHETPETGTLLRRFVEFVFEDRSG